MNGSEDELRQLWHASHAEKEIDMELVTHLVQQKGWEWERTIHRRDLRETIAGMIIAVTFAFFAWHTTDWLLRVSELWIAASGLWIIYWLRRHRVTWRDASSDLTLAAYHRSLLESYRRQIALLRTAKIWYVLPVWSGLMLFTFASWRLRHDNTRTLVQAGTFTLVFGFVWWLNESWGVRHLRRQEEQLSRLTTPGGNEPV